MSAIVKIVLILFVVLCIDSCKTDDLIVGTSSGGELAFTENVKLSSIPLWVRKKKVYYSGNQIIRGISAVDNLNTMSQAQVTEGGVGFTFTSIKLKSQRGKELNYQIQIFV